MNKSKKHKNLFECRNCLARIFIMIYFPTTKVGQMNEEQLTQNDSRGNN